jgi:UDP-3-O-[3-hydroxymyristoyl] N-acetylglucosamine deacetylase
VTPHPVSFQGIGLHTGSPSDVTLTPAERGFGIRFRRSDGREITAQAANVVGTGRCTVLGDSAGDRISTVEHLLSACAGLGVTDLLIETDAPELPIGDGSAACWVELLRNPVFTGGKPIDRPALSREILVTGRDGAFIAAYPSDTLRITVAISFPHVLIGTQVARYEPDAPGADYAAEIAGARTFGFIEEVEALRAAGLARGGTLDNAIVIYPDHFSSPLRFPNELARHKLLDMLGDLNLCGSAILPNADIIAVKPSHRLNVELAQRLGEHRGSSSSNED